MNKVLINSLFVIFAVMIIALLIKSMAATFEDYTEKKDSTYIVPYGRKLAVKVESGETIISSNENICKVEANNRMKIVGVGKFTLTSKKGEKEEVIDFFAWNVCLKKDGYTVFSDINKTNPAGTVYAKTYFAVSKTNEKKSLKIEEHLFTTGKYSNDELDGKYITSYYNETSAISEINNYEYALDNKFEEDDNDSNKDTEINPDEVVYDAKIKLGKTYTPNAETNLTWMVENEDVLKLEDSSKGTVRGIRIGTTKLIGKSGGTKKVEFTIKVYRGADQAVINVQSIKLDKNKVELNKKEVKAKPEEYKMTDKEKINATVIPEYADNRRVSWVSSNPSVASVSNKGRIKPKSDGQTTITASTISGARAVCEVTIYSGNKELNWAKGEECRSAFRVYNFSDGKMVIASDKRNERGKIQINTRYSENGKQWTAETKASFIDDYDCTNINLYEYNGALYMAYRATGTNVNNSSKFYSGLFVSVSYDKGKTWKYHSKIIEDTRESRNNRDLGVWEPVLGTLNGRLAVFYSNSSSEFNSNHAQKIEYKVLENGSWGERIVAISGGSSNRPGMPVWKQLSDGTVVVVFENNCKRGSGYNFIIQMACSLDGSAARNFSSPQDVYVPTKSGHTANSPGFVILPNSRRAVVAFHTSDILSSNSDKGPMMTVNSDVPIETIVKRLKGNQSIKEYFGNKQNIFNVYKAGETCWGALHYGNGYLYATASGHVKRIEID